MKLDIKLYEVTSNVRENDMFRHWNNSLHLFGEKKLVDWHSNYPKVLIIMVSILVI